MSTAIKVWHAKDLGYDGWSLMYRDEKGIAQYPTETDYEFDFVESKYLDEAVRIMTGACEYLQGYSCEGKDKIHHNCNPSENWHDPECSIAQIMSQYLKTVSRE